MNSESELLQKLMISKKIMDKHNDMGRGQSRNINMGDDFSSPMVENYEAPAARYNLPQDLLEESANIPQQRQSNVPMEDRIASSKLPDEIKRLMMEHPIGQPQQQPTTISNELIEKASRLMKENSNNYIPDAAKPKQVQAQPTPSVGNIDYNVIQKMITEAVNNALRENGLLMESSEKSNELFTFKVGKHVFEGKVTKIKKMS